MACRGTRSPAGVGVGAGATLFLLACNIAATVAVYRISTTYLVGKHSGIPDFIAGARLDGGGLASLACPPESAPRVTPRGLFTGYTPFFFLLMAVHVVVGMGRKSIGGQWAYADTQASLSAGVFSTLFGSLVLAPLGA